MTPTLPAKPAVVPLGYDFQGLNVRLNALRAEMLEMKTMGFLPDANLSEAENHKLAAAFQEKQRQLVLESLSILAALRKTSSGPARAGGKRAKKAPLDLDALEASIDL